MSYRTLLVHLDTTPRCAVRIGLAASLALAHAARVVGLSPTGMVHTRSPLYGYAPAGFAAEAALTLRTRAEGIASRFADEARRLGVGAAEARVDESDPIEAVMRHARYADLVIVGQTDPDSPSDDVPANFAQEVVVNAGRPVLLVPYAGTYPSVGRRVVAAWDGSREAARAFSDALPILSRAHKVHVLVFNSHHRAGQHGDLPGADIGGWLARHGVPVEVTHDRVDIDVAAAMLSRAADLSADLIVMGGYGHSRFRESILGGVTRSMFEQMTVPVLMSH